MGKRFFKHNQVGGGRGWVGRRKRVNSAGEGRHFCKGT